MLIYCASFSLAGPKGSNDDRLLEPVFSQGRFLAAIADGVGGNPGGGRAAELSLAAIAKRFQEFGRIDEQSILHAQKAVADEIQVYKQYSRMATTLSAITLSDGIAEILHVGDTRIYHLRSNGLQTRTEDQTEVAHLLRQGILKKSQVKDYSRRNVLLQYISATKFPSAQFTSFEIKYGDHIILMTDGAYDLLEKSRIVELTRSSATVETISKRLQMEINSSPQKDDASAIILRIS